MKSQFWNDDTREGEIPMAIAGVLETLQENLEHLAESEQKIARWILSHPEQMLPMTVRDLADAADSSQAAVVRLCRTLAVDSYSHLKVLVTADLVRREQEPADGYAELNPDTSFEAQLTWFGRAAADSIQATLARIRPDDLEAAAHRLDTAARIFLFGIAASALVAEDIAQKLLRLGYPASTWRDLHMAEVSAASLQPNDVAILVSFSGLTDEVIGLADLVRSRGAFLAAVTQFRPRPRNPLADRADLTLWVSASEPSPRIGATTSVMASLLVGDALMLWLANRDPARALKHLTATDTAVRQHRVESNSKGERHGV